MTLSASSLSLDPLLASLGAATPASTSPATGATGGDFAQLFPGLAAGAAGLPVTAPASGPALVGPGLLPASAGVIPTTLVVAGALPAAGAEPAAAAAATGPAGGPILATGIFTSPLDARGIAPAVPQPAEAIQVPLAPPSSEPSPLPAQREARVPAGGATTRRARVEEPPASSVAAPSSLLADAPPSPSLATSPAVAKATEVGTEPQVEDETSPVFAPEADAAVALTPAMIAQVLPVESAAPKGTRPPTSVQNPDDATDQVAPDGDRAGGRGRLAASANRWVAPQPGAPAARPTGERAERWSATAFSRPVTFTGAAPGEESLTTPDGAVAIPAATDSTPGGASATSSPAGSTSLPFPPAAEPGGRLALAGRPNSGAGEPAVSGAEPKDRPGQPQPLSGAVGVPASGPEGRAAAVVTATPAAETSVDASVAIAAEQPGPSEGGRRAPGVRPLARVSVAEKIAARHGVSRKRTEGEISILQKETESIIPKEVAAARPPLGTGVAIDGETMSLPLHRHRSPSETDFTSAGIKGAEAATPEMPAGEGDATVWAATGARRAVDAALNAAEQLAGGEQRSVSLKFTVGDTELALRVERRDDELHATFRTDSAELRAALVQECRAIADLPDRSFRLATQVTSSSAPATASSGESFADANSGRRELREAPSATGLPGLAGVRRRAAGPAVPASLGESVGRAAPASTSRHLHTVA